MPQAKICLSRKNDGQKVFYMCMDRQNVTGGGKSEDEMWNSFKAISYSDVGILSIFENAKAEDVYWPQGIFASFRYTLLQYNTIQSPKAILIVNDIIRRSQDLSNITIHAAIPSCHISPHAS